MYVADILSRAFIKGHVDDDKEMCEVVHNIIVDITD